MSVKGVANAIRTAAVRLSADLSVRPLNTHLVSVDERIAASFTASNILAAIVPTHINAAIYFSSAQLAYDLGIYLTHLRFENAFGAMDKALLGFFKTKTENLQLAEDVSFQFYKTISENLGFSDKQIFSIFKTVIDNAGAGDLYQVNFAKSRSEIAGARDLYNHVLSKSSKDTAGVRDVKGFTLFRLLNDSSTVLDFSSREFGKVNVESLRFTETRIKNISKLVSDSLKVTDDVDGSASIQDDQEVQFIKNVSRLVSIADKKILTVQTSKTDLARPTDSGSLRSQGYCDFTYFEEDFVGASRTF